MQNNSRPESRTRNRKPLYYGMRRPMAYATISRVVFFCESVGMPSYTSLHQQRKSLEIRPWPQCPHAPPLLPPPSTVRRVDWRPLPVNILPGQIAEAVKAKKRISRLPLNSVSPTLICLSSSGLSMSFHFVAHEIQEAGQRKFRTLLRLRISLRVILSLPPLSIPLRTSFVVTGDSTKSRH